jgi:hypothetical protein
VLYLPHSRSARGCTSIHFGENQLSPGSIGISPLSTGHPPVLQHRWVRASTGSHPRFTLPMDSSPGFGSHPRNAPPSGCPLVVGALFRLAFAPAPRLYRRLTSRSAASMHSSDHSTKGTPLARHPGCPRQHLCLRLLAGAGFQGLFHPPLGVLFTFPSRYSFPIGRQRYCALEGGPPRFPPDFACPVVLRYPEPTRAPTRRLRGSHPLRHAVPGVSADSRPFDSLPGGDVAVAPLGPTTPRGPACAAPHGLGSSRFARRYYGNLA